MYNTYQQLFEVLNSELIQRRPPVELSGSAKSRLDRFCSEYDALMDEFMCDSTKVFVGADGNLTLESVVSDIVVQDPDTEELFVRIALLAKTIRVQWLSQGKMKFSVILDFEGDRD